MKGTYGDEAMLLLQSCISARAGTGACASAGVSASVSLMLVPGAGASEVCKHDLKGTNFGHPKDLEWQRSTTCELKKCWRKLTSYQTLGQILDCEILVLEGGTILVVEPSQLLKNLGVTRIIHNMLVGIFGLRMLKRPSELSPILSGTRKGGEELTSFCCSYTCPIWNQMLAWASGLGGLQRIWSKHCRESSYFPCCLYIMPRQERISFALSKSKSCTISLNRGQKRW